MCLGQQLVPADPRLQSPACYCAGICTGSGLYRVVSKLTLRVQYPNTRHLPETVVTIPVLTQKALSSPHLGTLDP